MLETENTFETSSEQPAVKRSRRRIDPSSIFVAVLVATAAAGLYYMHWSTADTQKLVANAGTAAASVDTFLSGGKTGLDTLRKSIRQTQGTVAKLTRTPVPASSVVDSRDPFEFESLEPKNTAAVAPPSTSAREQAKSRLLEAARKLTVQSILVGSARRSCLINGKLYFEGGSCGEFLIESIAQDSVFLQGGEFRFELKLRR